MRMICLIQPFLLFITFSYTVRARDRGGLILSSSFHILCVNVSGQ